MHMPHHALVIVVHTPHAYTTSLARPSQLPNPAPQSCSPLVSEIRAQSSPRSASRAIGSSCARCKSKVVIVSAQLFLCLRARGLG
eukprot:8529573-Pyramimonas_sp.AAC.4